MGSSYFGMSSMGNEKSSSSSSSSSRKSKKSGSEKPKQPQRGLGVAQLEQIRMRSQLGCGFPPSVVHGTTGLLHQEDMRVQGVPNYGVPAQSSTSYPNYSQSSPSTSTPYTHHHPNFMMVFGDERANSRYQDSQPSTTSARWNPNSSGAIDNSPYTQAGIGYRHSFSHFEDSRQRIDMLKSMGSRSQNSDSSDHEEVDLELRLSL